MAAIIREAVSSYAVVTLFAILVSIAGRETIVKKTGAAEASIPLWTIVVCVAVTVIIKTKAVDTLLSFWAVGVDTTGPDIPWNAPAFYVPVRILLIADPVAAAPFCTTWAITTQVTTSPRRTASRSTSTTNLNAPVITARVEPVITGSTCAATATLARVRGCGLNTETANAGKPNSTALLTNAARGLAGFNNVRARVVLINKPADVLISGSLAEEDVPRVCEGTFLNPLGIVVH